MTTVIRWTRALLCVAAVWPMCLGAGQEPSRLGEVSLLAVNDAFELSNFKSLDVSWTDYYPGKDRTKTGLMCTCRIGPDWRRLSSEFRADGDGEV